MTTRDRGPTVQDARMHLRHLRRQERMRRRLCAQLRRGQYAHAERTLAEVEITDDVLPLLREHATRAARIAERFRQLSER
jgi:hypothetical protein